MVSDFTEKPPLFKRDHRGELIPQEIDLKNGESVFLIPLTIGELNSIQDDDYTDYILCNAIKKPIFKDNEIKHIKPEYSDMLCESVLFLSGINLKKKKKSQVNDAFGKRLLRVKKERSEMDITLFLHEHGYTFFNMNKLTYPELNNLMEAKNRRIEKENKTRKKARSKSNRGRR